VAHAEIYPGSPFGRNRFEALQSSGAPHSEKAQGFREIASAFALRIGLES
jgi:hypothetical protein